MMDRREALAILQEVLDSFPSDQVMLDLEPIPAGPGYRYYSSENFSDAFIRSARKALDFLREDERC